MTNPKTPGKACYDRYQSYKHATNPAESFEMGGTRADLKYDINRGFAFVEDAELRRQLGLSDTRGKGGGNISLTQCATATLGSDASDDQGEETDEEHRAEDAAAATRNAHRQATATACGLPRPLPPKKRRKVEDWQAHPGQRQQHDRMCELFRAHPADTKVAQWRQIAALILGEDWRQRQEEGATEPTAPARKRPKRPPMKTKAHIKAQIQRDHIDMIHISCEQNWLTKPEKQQLKWNTEQLHLEADREGDERYSFPQGTVTRGRMDRTYEYPRGGCPPRTATNNPAPNDATSAGNASRSKQRKRQGKRAHGTATQPTGLGRPTQQVQARCRSDSANGSEDAGWAEAALHPRWISNGHSRPNAMQHIPRPPRRSRYKRASHRLRKRGLLEGATTDAAGQARMRVTRQGALCNVHPHQPSSRTHKNRWRQPAERRSQCATKHSCKR